MLGLREIIAAGGLGVGKGLADDGVEVGVYHCNDWSGGHLLDSGSSVAAKFRSQTARPSTSPRSSMASACCAA